jgi:hypothetical protein
MDQGEDFVQDAVEEIRSARVATLSNLRDLCSSIADE